MLVCQGELSKLPRRKALAISSTKGFPGIRIFSKAVEKRLFSLQSKQSRNLSKIICPFSPVLKVPCSTPNPYVGGAIGNSPSFIIVKGGLVFFEDSRASLYNLASFSAVDHDGGLVLNLILSGV